MPFERVEFSLLAFAACWLIIVAVHTVAAAYYVVVAIFYWRLYHTYLKYFLEHFNIGMNIKHCRTIALVHFVCAIPHSICLFAILGGSSIQRKLSFWFALPTGNTRFSASPFTSSAVQRVMLSTLNCVGSIHSSCKRACASVAATRTAINTFLFIKTGYFIIDSVIGPTGLLGVNGKHFDTILIVRELVEMVLQSIQAYKMSQLLPRVAINQIYTSLIIINCWMTAFIRFRFAKRVAYVRFLSILFDCALNFIASIGITLTIVSFYFKDYDWTISGFRSELWIQDVWSTQALSELQLVFVVSWADLGTRIVFAISIMSSLGDVKSLLSLRPRQNVVHLASTVPDSEMTMHAPHEPRYHTVISPEHIKSMLPQNLVRPISFTAQKVNVIRSACETIRFACDDDTNNFNPAESLQTTVISESKAIDPIISETKRLYKRLATIFAYILVAWGIIMLVLHLHAASLPTVDQCILQVRPWGEAAPHCSLVLLDCYHLHIDGRKDQIETLWREFGRGAVERILIRHCPQLEIPPLFQEFEALTALKIYNSTISEWNADAAVTGSTHPRIAFVYLIRMTFPDGTVPEGLLFLSTSSTLLEVTICVSNLRELPDDLDQHWPKGVAIYIDYSQLKSIPDCIIRLKPLWLSMYGNPFHSIPSALFEIEGMTDLNVGGCLIQALPENVTSLSSTLTYVFVPNTSLSYFPSWIDPIIERATLDDLPSLYVAETPYCSAWERVLSGSTSELEGIPVSKSLLMDVKEHREDINIHLTCDPYCAQPFYPLVVDDVAAAVVLRPEDKFPSNSIYSGSE